MDVTMNDRSLYPRMVAALLALLGLLDASYLALERLSGGALACPIGGGCETVQNSSYALFLGVPVAYIGVAGYAALLAVALLSLHRVSVGSLPLPALLLAIASAGLIFSAYLTYLQIAVIGAICFWCVVSALLELGIWVAALVSWRGARPHQPSASVPAPRRTSRSKQRRRAS
jgi:uncharacterized membrane protein